MNCPECKQPVGHDAYSIGDMIVGVDLGGKHDLTAISLVGLTGDGARLFHTEVFGNTAIFNQMLMSFRPVPFVPEVER